MSRLIIVEGARGTGKSTVTRLLRDGLPATTLINFTGFLEDGDEGLKKVTSYYDVWFDALFQLKNRVPHQTVICDRFFTSEMVYSELVKSYDFYGAYQEYLYRLPMLADEVFYFYLTVDNPEIYKERLNRNKIPFHIAESADFSMRQQAEYERVWTEVGESGGVRNYAIMTDDRTPEEIAQTIFGLLHQGQQ